MIERVYKIAQLIINAHTSDVRLLFQRYGINQEPTAQGIVDAYLVYGDPFLSELAAIVDSNPYSNATGLEIDKLNAYKDSQTAKAAELSKSNSSFGDKLMNIFNNAGSILNSVAGAYTTVSSVFSGKKVDTSGTDLQTEMYKAQLEAQQAQQSNQTKTLILVFAGVAIVALVLVMLFRSKQNV